MNSQLLRRLFPCSEVLYALAGSFSEQADIQNQETAELTAHYWYHCSNHQAVCAIGGRC